MTYAIRQPVPQHAEHWSQLESYGTPLTFARHSLIYTPGQAAQTLYLLQEGQISLQLISSNGRALTLQVVEPGQVFGYSVLMANQTYDTFAEAIRPARVMAFTRSELLRALERRPELGIALLEALGQHRLTISRRLDEVAFKSVPARLASLLLDMADNAPGEPHSRLPRRTHQQLAEMINAYRETVTKVMNQFREARLLDIDRSGITLLNVSRLREVARG
jgi:CRP-like cAMP-binding protein